MTTIQQFQLRSWKTVVLVGLLAGAVMVLHDGIAAAAGSTDAIATCERVVSEASVYGRIDAIDRAEADDLATIAGWQEAKVASMIAWVSPLRDLAPSGLWTVCLYRGEFVTPTTPGPDGSASAPHNMLRILVSDAGELVLDSAGYAGRMAPETPDDWLSSTRQ